ncbi:MAG: PEP-utilizing enzyme [Caldilineaceae bacterium]
MMSDPVSLREQESPIQLASSLDFPVVWESPEDQTFFFLHERTHFPEQVKPLDFFLNVKKMEEGFNLAAFAYGLPVRLHDRLINTYVYEAIVSCSSSSEATITQADQWQAKVTAAMFSLDDLWANQWLPEIKVLLAYWETYNLRTASLSALLQHLKTTEKHLQRLWEIHFSLFFPMMLGIEQFVEMYHDLFDGAQFEAYELLAGFENQSLARDQALWALSREALASPAVCRILADGGERDAMTSFTEAEDARLFWEKLNDYLLRYGRQGDKWSLDDPTWLEDPTPVLMQLKDYITQPDRDFAAEMKRRGEQREQCIAQARRKLERYPQPIVAQFEQQLRIAQHANTLSEDHAYWLDYQALYHTRRILLEIGCRLVDLGAIDTVDAIFYLTLTELQEALAMPSSSSLCQLVDERRNQERHFSQIKPPLILGTVPSDAPPEDTFSRALAKFFGGPPLTSETPNEIQGYPGSPGIVRGPAKILNSLEEVDQVAPGDILVTETTAPPWTPLFGSVAAIVTDTGGILSHCAVVAREYGIPAVVGAGIATTTIQNGQMIEVDGNSGVVRVLASLGRYKEELPLPR